LIIGFQDTVENVGDVTQCHIVTQDGTQCIVTSRAFLYHKNSHAGGTVG